MANSRDAVLARVQAAAIDGRMRTLRFRQRQLQSVFKYMSEHSTSFIEAAQTDDGCLRHEAEIEFASVLIDLRNHYDALDLITDLEQEYSIAKGKSNEERNLPVGITYIIPDTHNVFFGIMSALCGAIEAGSCCILQLENTVRSTSGLLRQLFSASLDHEAFGIVTSSSGSEFLAQCVVVDQAQRLKALDLSPKQRILVSSTKQNIALVDRTAEIELAAKEIVTSRMAFAGKGRYAPDLVLINEFVANKWIEAAVRALKKCQQASLQSKHARSEIESSVEREVKQGKVNLIHGDAHTGILEVLDRSSSFIHGKASSRLFVINRITSLDDPIDLLNSSQDIPNISALYLFSAPREAKYLSQYIPSQMTFVNHFPAQLLVGPSTPVGHRVSLRTRYSRCMFEYPSPQIVQGPRSHLSSKILSGPDKSAWLVSVAQKPLKSTGQPPAGAWGFFEQGMVLGALVYLIPILSVSLFGAGYAGLIGYRKAFGS